MSRRPRHQAPGLEPIRIEKKRIRAVNGERLTYFVERVARKLAFADEAPHPKAINLSKELDLLPRRVEQAEELARMLRRTA